MKKVAIFGERMSIGGCEKALISMLENLPREGYEYTLFLLEKEGELLNDIPKWINIKTIPFIDKDYKQIIIHYMKSFKFLRVITSIFYIILQFKSNYYGQFYYRSKILPTIKENYDLAISYCFPGQFSDWYVANNVKSKKKVVWIHSDISKFLGINNFAYEKMYKKYDNIFCVSKECKKVFLDKFPSAIDKTDVFYNIISKQKLIELATLDNGFSDDYEGIRILTVGRLDEAKGQDFIPNILFRLKNEGYDIKWYCIGDGDLKAILEKQIEEKGLQENLILLGSKKNPYPYIRDCDVYVQTSRYEAYCISICEARCFNKPIVSTDFTGIKDQIKNNENGLIAGISEDEIYEELKKLLDSEYMRKKFILNLKNTCVDTRKEINKLISIV